MELSPNLRVVVDGDTSRVYRQGDQVKGRVILVLEEPEQIKGLSIAFGGVCTTKTTRPCYNSGNDANARQSRREYEEQIELFYFEKSVISETSLAANKYSWNFEFKFPEQTKDQFSRFAHGSKYLKVPHGLPPTFQAFTSNPGGLATVSYYLQAKLEQDGATGTKRVTELLGYLPNLSNAPLEPKIQSRVLYAQIWKLGKDSRTAMDKVFSKVSRKASENTSVPRIVPTLHFPEKIAPGQHIPILLSLASANGRAQPDCILDSLTVSLSTYTTLMCGQPMTQPEDVVSKQVTCISKRDINQPLPFSTPTLLTTNFRLVDDGECVPTFRTYTITRRYTMTIVVGLKSQERRFTIRSTTPLEILPRMSPSELSTPLDHDGEVDPLPLYVPREPSKEFAPDYEELYSLSPTPPSSLTLALEGSRGSSLASGLSTPSTAPTTPESELDESVFEETMRREYGGIRR